ncbi:YqhA family protein [Cyanobium sp. Morenito 9A2]|uniref:YqhA family protein n=1 Tax=Cyanobium sp. Morenito 9A2 TaxID=2823718 RepID=UPI0020CF930D|nr:YqhA family protein [Cyanobium sp. Morenito 9A2]MCP9849998.1 YqhA family protein [Cyanobium sp. Morenito 9A2]
MINRLLLQARYLIVIAVLGLLAASIAFYLMGAHLVVDQLDEAFWGEFKNITGFELQILQAIDMFLVGTGCLALGIGMFSLFVKELPLPEPVRVRSFHEVKSMFANFLILSLAVSFLENLGHLEETVKTNHSNGSEILYAGAGVALVTGALLAFKYFGAERHGTH